MTTDSDRVPDEPGVGFLDALVEAERASMQPPKGAKGQTWKRVVGTVAVDAPLPVEPTSIAGPAAASSAPWLKVVLGLVLGGVVAVGVYGLANDPEPEPAATTPARAADEPRDTPPPPPSRPAAAPTEPAPPLPVSAPAPAAPPPASAERAGTPVNKPPPEPDPPASDLAEETRLLARARARLRAGSPREALAPLAEHARRFPQGQLAEDRMVLKAQALCEAGDRKAGRKSAAALRKAFPSSSHLPRVDRACE